MKPNLPLTLLFLALVVPPLPAAAMSPQEQLQADHAAWRDARLEYENRMATGRMAEAERRDYEGFLDELAARVVHGCANLRAQGAALPQDVACPDNAVAGSASARDVREDAPPPGAERAALDAELGASLGRFDELLLREQDRVRATKPRTDSRGGDGTASASAGGSASSGAGTQVGGASTGAGGAGGQGTQGAQDAIGGQGTAASGGGVSGQGLPGGLPGGQGGREGGGQGGDPGQGGLGGPAGSGTAATTPADVPDPSGDDVVARQLREAAEAERDPELRERLWDEYRRYRRGID